MKTLILMRHAKSSWAEPGQDDHARPLNKRGRRAAPAMGAWLAAEGLLPDRVLCSTAQRVRETYDGLCAALPDLAAPTWHDGLYHAGPGALQAHLAALPRDCAAALLIAHEPGLSTYLQQLGGTGAPAACQRAYSHYPTGAMAVLKIRAEAWDALSPATADFVRFAVPREIMEAT